MKSIPRSRFLPVDLFVCHFASDRPIKLVIDVNDTGDDMDFKSAWGSQALPAKHLCS
jgi:hypothetical protein